MQILTILDKKYLCSANQIICEFFQVNKLVRKPAADTRPEESVNL